MDSIVEEFDPEKHPRTTFNTSDEEKHVSDCYFLESVDKIRFFYEEAAVDEQSGRLKVPKELALNKVGHALHWLDHNFRKFTFHERIKRIVSLTGAVEPRVVQSMYIFKQPYIGGATHEHVDSTFLHTEHPNNLLGIWIALDSARLDNGCLWFIPGSHKDPRCLSLTKQYKFTSTEAARNERNIAKPSVIGDMLKFLGVRPSFEGYNFVPVECPAGSLVLIHGDVVHKSGQNLSENSRHAYTFHLVDFAGESKGWSSTNWLQGNDTYEFPELFKNE
uniref:Phytanoyl-CoA dioxygenase n=1 Tax=Globodera rostochiensis TaxID=31243 RepID=A0A914H5Z7_GLORO